MSAWMGRRVAVPSDLPGGVAAEASAHFGQCGCFTVVDIGESGELSPHVLENSGHSQGGCLAPVNLLVEDGVEVLLAQGIGRSPCIALGERGVAVLVARGETVMDMLDQLTEGKATPVNDTDLCGKC